MKALKINVEERIVEVINIENFTDIYPHIGNECHTFTCPEVLPNNDSLYVDDEGLLKEMKGFFSIGDSAPFVGNAVLQGTNAEGDSVSVVSTKEEIESKITWYSFDELPAQYRNAAAFINQTDGI
jgi:hypothetical protein